MNSETAMLERLALGPDILRQFRAHLAAHFDGGLFVIGNGDHVLNWVEAQLLEPLEHFRGELADLALLAS